MAGLPGDVSEEPVLILQPSLSVTSPTSQLILQAFRRLTYVTAHSPTLPFLHLRHSSFSSPSFASPTLITKFSQNIVADTDKKKALTDCHKCSSSFLSIVKSHPLKIPASVLEKVRAGICLKLFLIDCILLRYKLYINKCVEGVCLHIDYFCTILCFLSVSYKAMTIRVVFSFVFVCLFVPRSLENGWMDFNQTRYP